MSFSADTRSFRICVLAYSRILHIVHDVIRQLPDTGVEYIVIEAGLADQDACVTRAIRQGCEIFVAGPAGATLFANHYSYPVIPFQVQDIDYLRAIRTALDQGYQHIGIMRYRHAAPLHLDVFQQLMKIRLTELVYDAIPQIYSIARKTQCDILIGPAAAQDAADAAGKASLLVYAGREAIRDACLAAGEQIKRIYAARRHRVITESLLGTTQLGIVIINTEQVIEFFNRTMQNYTGLTLHQVSGRTLTEIFPNLPLDTFLKSGLSQKDSYHVINGTMMRCVFSRITIGFHAGGVLLTFHPTPHNTKKDRKQQRYTIAPVYKLEKITAYSPVMSHLVQLCRHISPIEYATTLIGPAGCGGEELAHCLHNASRRSGNPCMTLDCSSTTDEQAVSTLYGRTQNGYTRSGLFFHAAGGSIIIIHPGLAGPRLLAILQEVLTKQQYISPENGEPVVLDILFYTVATDQEYRQLPIWLRRLLSIHCLTLPPLRDRPEDICELFVSYVHQQLPQKRHTHLSEHMTQLLTTYSWPGNIIELRSVSIRYALQLKTAASPTLRYRYQLLMEAIGENNVKEDLYLQYPALMETPVTDLKNFRAGIQKLHSLFGCTYKEIAEKLNMSRTTLWRLLHST